MSDVIALCFSIIQQFSGVSVIRAYVVKIFDEVFSRDVIIISYNDTVRNSTDGKQNRFQTGFPKSYQKI